MSGNAVCLDRVTKVFRGKRLARVQALTDLSLSLSEGEVFGYLGPNGAGKSTTIKILMGLIQATSGSASIFGSDVCTSNARCKIGYLPENPVFYEHLTGEEYVKFVGRAFGMSNPELSRKTDQVLDLLDIRDARRRPMRSYSKGMVQRIGLAQVLVHDPELYILDEPMSGLDPLGRALVKRIILDLKVRGKTVFFSTHITSDVELVCDRVAIIDGGILKAAGSVESLVLQGVRGYQVAARESGSGIMKTIPVSVDELPHKLEELQRERYEIILVEPVRRTLEDLFVETVGEG